jgi:hypothetical protein
MTLQEKLQQFKEGALAGLSDAEVALMENVTRELIHSGIAQQAKQVGDQAPRFRLPDTNGRRVNLAQRLTQGPVVITFYRGVW